ncbi:MAG: hypothetical protein D8M59_08520 [Planctomycetes bacterium]|nr:hypothetical protein [Planctomycetota bacterium]NOG53960.1 hypothetical protein [Planctomycetota bacterium]
MDQIIKLFTDEPWLFIFVFLAFVTVCRTLTKIASTTSKERTRREIAAYIAEGSMTPEQGERLLAAGKKKGICEDC